MVRHNAGIILKRNFRRFVSTFRRRIKFRMMEPDEGGKCEIQDLDACSNDEIICFENLTHVQKAQVRKETDKSFFCKKHLEKQFRIFKLHQNQCCDPLGVHKVGIRVDLREISEDDFNDFGHILDVAAGQKLCRNCKFDTLPEYLTNYHQNSENHTDSGSQNTLSRVDDLPVDSSHSSAGYSGDLEVQNARQAIKLVSNTLDVPDVIGRLSVKRCLDETFDQISESLAKKMRILNPGFEGPSTLLEEARFYKEIIQQLKDKLSNCESSRERYLLLTVLPRTWSAYQIQQVMGVSQKTAKRAKELMETHGILCLVPSKSGRVLDPDVVKMIEDFYSSDDMSRIQPGKNDYVSVLINGNKVERQKRLLLCNLKECYQSFKDEYPEISVGFSRFAEARPPNVILAGASGTHTVCVCKIHQNFKLLLHALDLESIDDQLRKWTYKDVLASIMCSPPTNECYFRECLCCPDIKSIVDEMNHILQRESIAEITFKQWTNVDRSALETLTQKLPQVMEAILGSLPDLLKHDFLAKEQSRYVKERKKSLAFGEVLAGGDFAENHSFPIQDEVQDHHWNNDQVTIHPWVCYFVDETTKASMQRPLDGQITNAEELFAWAQTLNTSMKIVFVPKEEIIQNEVFLNERNEGVKTIEGTRGYHSFEPLDEERIRVKKYSSSQDYKDVIIKRKQKK
ncbi:hypothetical protein QAD02_006317 [Eretmocerus hayati]|uniref:Uncharacterized protein n=1 Tax=Eretmocerus hayati TaxID=131215 RepID=A0ACC2N0J0_9HYME|nr:hypothetical protein QAD02_006317 [Eretmocerus hayati]